MGYVTVAMGGERASFGPQKMPLTSADRAGGAAYSKAAGKAKAAVGDASNRPELVGSSGDDTEPEEGEPLLQRRRMTWRMLISTADGVVSSAGASAKPDKGEPDEDSAEYEYLSREQEEREKVEKSSAQAKNSGDVLWYSDTRATGIAENHRSRVKQFAKAAQVHDARCDVRGLGGRGRARRTSVHACTPCIFIACVHLRMFVFTHLLCCSIAHRICLGRVDSDGCLLALSIAGRGFLTMMTGGVARVRNCSTV